jgi:hypothetical protein
VASTPTSTSSSSITPTNAAFRAVFGGLVRASERMEAVTTTTPVPDYTLDRETLEEYGARIAERKVTAKQASRVVHDAEEWRALQRNLRQVPCMTDALLKQTLQETLRSHWKDLELKQAAKLQVQAAVAEETAWKMELQNKSNGVATTPSPTSVLHTLSVDTNVAAREAVGAPPLSSTTSLA